MSINLREFKKPKGSYFSVVENYWNKSINQSRNRTIYTIGYLSNYMRPYDENDEQDRAAAEAEARAKVMEIFENVKAENTTNDIETIRIDMNAQMDINTDNCKNVGYGILKHIYKELELDLFWRKAAEGRNFEYDPEQIFQLLVFGRIIFPGSKKKTYEMRNRLFEGYDGFTLEDVYKALDFYAENEEKLQKWIYDHSVTKYNRKLDIGYFDCTNYYYDISRPDQDEYDEEGKLVLKRYRKYGPEKNHRKDPIVEMGLLMDGSGIPLSYDMFPGNESEKVHMLPIINRTSVQFGLGRIVVVADRGLNTSDNVYRLNGKNDQDDNPRDGYVYGQSVRGADAEFKQWVLDQNGYIDTPVETDDISDDRVFRHKSRIYPKKIQITRTKEDGKTVKQSITVDQKQMVYYSEKYAKKQRIDRQRSIERALDLINHPKKYDKASAKGASGYVLNLSYDKNTGEIIERDLVLDEEKIKEEEKYDGYYSIVTSELKLSDTEIRKIYRGLIHIEDTFKLTKAELDARPVFCRTNDHIDAHFVICFTAIVLIRLLEKKLEEKYPVGQVIESLRNYNCTNIDKNLYHFMMYNNIIADCGEKLGIDLSRKTRTGVELRRTLRY
ncbi:MAG: IS1634 family transposase [Erysipelotrichaceae bacterium]|nr:IS1634 family transposase [Erysipelotrichaceae bacterium]MDY3660868.1 IS1634 family transposase [Bulleidia sp.]